VEEAIGASSRKDFINKITIAYKEARESSYWLLLLRDTGFLTEQESQDLITRINVLLKLLGTIQKTSKRNQEAPNNPSKPLVGKE
jgi:four helix bundle protein